MEEMVDQEQGYVCKICHKSFASVKSLGGHTRVHLPKSKSKMEFKAAGFQNGSSRNQSNSSLCIKVKIKSCNPKPTSLDSDQHNTYELRENPKRSWRIPDSKNGGDEGVSCKECGKEFSSLRALSGHMRWHTTKNKEVHQCKQCGKGFDSMRAMFGHMTSHSKRSRLDDDSSLGLSNSFPIRRKRSRIRYNVAQDPSFSSLSGSTSFVSEVEMAASCLLMLSKGLGDWIRLDAGAESSNGDSVCFETGLNIAGNDGDFLSGPIEMSTPSLSREELGHCVPDSVTEKKNVSRLDDLRSKFADGFENSDDCGLSVGNEVKIQLKVSDEELLCIGELKEPEAHSSTDHIRYNSSHLEHDESDNVDIICFDRVSGGQKADQYSEATDVNQETSGVRDFLDLNFPVTVEGAIDVGRNLWWVDRGQEHQSLVLDTCQTNSMMTLSLS